MTIDVQVFGVNELAGRLENPELIGVPLRRGLDRAGFIVESRAKELAPVYRGRLRSSIVHRVDSSAVPLFCEVGTNVEYAQAVHEGRPPGTWPPVAPLMAWAERRGMGANVGYLIARKIFRYGVDAKPFLRQGLEDRSPEVMDAMDYAMREIRL